MAMRGPYARRLRWLPDEPALRPYDLRSREACLSSLGPKSLAKELAVISVDPVFVARSRGEQRKHAELCADLALSATSPVGVSERSREGDSYERQHRTSPERSASPDVEGGFASRSPTAGGGRTSQHRTSA